MDCIYEILSTLKSPVRTWEWKKKSRLYAGLNILSDEIQEISCCLKEGRPTQNDPNKLKFMEQRCKKNLMIQENTWRLKSWAIWKQVTEIKNYFIDFQISGEIKMLSGVFGVNMEPISTQMRRSSMRHSNILVDSLRTGLR